MALFACVNMCCVGANCQETPAAVTQSTEQSQSAQAQTSAQPQPADAGANFLEPVVARMEMHLKLSDKLVDKIEKGDLLTVLSEREDSYVIQTFAGQKGAVAKVNVAKLAESVEIYDALIEAQPKEGRLYTLRAGAHWAIANDEQALADFNKAIELGYNAGHAFSSRGLFHAAIGEYDAAIADYAIAIEKDPKDEVALINRASVYMSTGKYENAVNDYTRCIQLNSTNPIYYQQRAIANKLLEKFEPAIADYDKSIELQPGNVTSWMGRGFIKFQMGQHQAAVTDFSKVIELAPGTAVAFNNRGYNYQALKQYAQALTDYNEALQLAPKYLLALQNRGWLLATCEDASIRNPDLAIETAKAACELSQFQDLGDLMLLAAAHASKGQFQEAIGWQEKIIGRAQGVQLEIAKKVHELYQQNKPIDPKLLEVAEPEVQAEAADNVPEKEEPPKPEVHKSDAPSAEKT